MTNFLTSQFAILNKTKSPLVIKNLRIPELKKNQLLVEIKYSYVCGSQLNEIFGLKGKDKHLPHTLGHEGSGIIRSIGKNIKDIKTGDRVVLSWITNKKNNSSNPYYLDNKNKIINSGLVSTFSKFAIVSSNRVYKINNNNVPLDIAALLGCASPTGFGIVLKHITNFDKKYFVGIYGAGGVGLMSLIALNFLGIKNIYVIDKNKKNLRIAKDFGCKYAVTNEQFINKVIGKKININQIKYNLEMSGNKKMMAQAINILSTSGTVILAGNIKKGEFVDLNPYDLIFGKKIFGFSANNISLNKNLKLYLKILQKINYKKLRKIFKVYKLNHINKAISDFKSGKVIRPLIKL
jgi:S-(hydroxymethyl)glutathione dehydrogenase/alcohol dehydrogenase